MPTLINYFFKLLKINMKTKLIFPAFVAVFFKVTFLLTGSGYSCTTFCISTNYEIVFGKNYDFQTGDGIIFVNKKEVVKKAFTKKGIPAEWISKFGSVTFNQYGREFPMGGMNEAGLVIELMWLDETKYPPQDDRNTVGGILQWIQYQIDNCETIQEVIDTDKFLRIPEGAVPVHYLAADKYGNTASIEFLNGKLVAHSGGTMKFKSLTNDTYERSIEYLKNFKEFGGTDEISADRSSLNRFAISCSMLNEYSKEKNGNAVDYGFKILNSVSQSVSTRWSIVYDIKNLIVYFLTDENANRKNIEFSGLDFNCSSPVLMIDINSDIKGNINSSMTDYKTAANRQLIDDSYGKVDFLRNVPEEYRQEASVYPEMLTCKSKSGIEINNVDSNRSSPGKSIIILIGVTLSLIITGSILFFHRMRSIKNLHSHS